MREKNSKLVYSTGQTVPRREAAPGKTIAATAPVQQKVTVRLDRKGRGGKSVTVVDAPQMTRKESESLLSQFKTRFGTRGAVKDAGFEIQGDHRDAILAALEAMGYRPKSSGG